MPQHVDAEKQWVAEQQLEKELRAEKLATVDSILWRTNFLEQDRASQETTGKLHTLVAVGCFTNKALARLCHRAFVLCTQCIEVTLDDVHLEVSQQDESGPRGAIGSTLEGKDSLRLSIRQLLLTPQGASGEAEPPKPGVQEKHASGWWDMLCAPGALTRFLMYETPSAAKLEVAGFSLSLCSYDARQPSEHTQAGTPGASSSHAAPAVHSTFSSGPFSEVLPTMPAAAHVTHAGRRPDLAQPFRRRKRLRAAGARTAATLSGAPAPENLFGGMAPLDRDFPVQEHVLVQQWGFSIDVRVLPPLWREPESSEPLLQKNMNHDTRPSMYTNPLYTSEETSTSSVSDTVEMMEDLRHTVSSIPEAAEVAEADAQPGLARRRVQGEVGSRNAYAPPGRPPGISSLNGLGMADGHKGFEKPCKVKPQPDASCTVEVDVLLRAFVPVLSAQSAAVAIRMLERLQQFEEYERFWRVRPQKLYTKASANLGTFHEPSRRWWQRRVAAANKAERAELAVLESSLTLEEIAHFRAGVAAVHSRLLAVDHGVLQHAMDAVDAIVGTPGAVPQQVEDMLFQRCAQGRGAPEAPPVVVSMSVSCPKLGLQLAVGEEWMALTPRVPLSPFHTLEAAIRDVSFSVKPTGMPPPSSECCYVQ
ncbi:hypothetical protein COCOBI_12-5540 [Coccomyxa sp. Obi]|nr:hypothetical protein COCOBI_12-5540 [Coccomyxa sp. Obi]